MRISRRTSGGRGEYEISEVSPEGIGPTDLLGRHLKLGFDDDWLVDTGCTVTAQGGKRRIRMTFGAEMHPHLQLAAALLMPHPVRADEPLGSGAPVLKTDRYAIEQIEFNRVELPTSDTAVLHVGEVILRNVSYHFELLNFLDRIQKVRRLWTHSDELPEQLAALIKDHEKLATVGPIPKVASKLVEMMQRAVTEAAPDLGIVYRNASEDVVPDLINALSAGEEPPAPPVPLEQIDPEEIEIRRRTVKDWKRWANSRGAASAKFRQEVRRAYNSTCLVCGLHLPSTPFNPVPGVEAAHILPWSGYDLDHVSNGLCLCRNHHWAFDEGLIELTFKDGDYFLLVPEEVVNGIRKVNPDFSIDDLLRHAGGIPSTRFPTSVKDRPSGRFLNLLRENG